MLPFFKGPRRVDKTQDSPKIKEGLKKIDDVKVMVLKIAKLVGVLQQKVSAQFRAGETFGELLGQFPEKDKTMPLPPQASEESGFTLAILKFSEVFKDVAHLESAFCEECEKFVTALNDFANNHLVETTKKLKKQYDNARAEYDKILVKIAALKDNKRLPIVKLYEAEKLRSKLQKDYEKATLALEQHCEELDDVMNTVLLENFIVFFEAQKNMLGLSYGQLDDIKGYLIELREWCKQEEQICKDYCKDRHEKHLQVHRDDVHNNRQQFAQVFTVELVQLVINTVPDLDPSSVYTSFIHFFKKVGIPIPEGFTQLPHTQLDVNDTPPLDVQEIVKNNFDAIGMKLIMDNNRDQLIALGEVLAGLEQLPS